jgi:hypothetical protein
MPSINVTIQPGGPILDVFIGVSLPRARVLTSSSQSVPLASRGKFLIDTGASATAVDHSLIQPLGLQPIGKLAISTPSTAAGTHHFCDQYDVSLFIPANQPPASGYLIEALPIVTTHLSHQGIDGLIGRDILNNCTLIYNGAMAIVTLSY